MEYILIVIVVIMGFTIGMLSLPQTIANIPPTDAFSQIWSGGQSINASSFDANFTVNTQGSMTTSIINHNLNFKLSQQTCSAGNAFTSIDSNGFLVCGSVSP